MRFPRTHLKGDMESIFTCGVLFWSFQLGSYGHPLPFSDLYSSTGTFIAFVTAMEGRALKRHVQAQKILFFVFNSACDPVFDHLSTELGLDDEVLIL